MASTHANALNVFVSYSHHDEALRDELETHLSLLKQEGAICTWHDRRIGAGREWEGEIDRHLDAAHLVLLLISPDFIASKYCVDCELDHAMERDLAGEARVVPVILRPTDWQTATFARLQALPRDGRAVTIWPNKDEAFVDVVRGLRSAVAELRQPASTVAKATPPKPSYADEATRKLSESLDAAYRRRAELGASGEDTEAVMEEILRLRRRLRQGAQLKAGDFLLDGRFQLLEVIGHGGFAHVWKAYDRDGRALVAVKVLHGQHTDDASRRERFFRGARQMARLSHPNVARVIEEECEDGEYSFFVMEYLGGGDFRQAVLNDRFSLAERLQIVVEVGAALALAHARGVIHRDVKPHNILLDVDGSPKLTDFDLVRAADTTGGTRTSMLGTFLYAAPEAMADARQAAERADVYGLGMTAIFALHGADLPVDILWELPELLAKLEVNDAIRRVLHQAVARKLEGRWPTVDAFRDALREALSQSSRLAPTSDHRPWLGGWRREGEVRHEVDGSVLVFVPGDEFCLGTNRSLGEYTESWQKRWQPAHRITLSPYWIGKHPVTNAQYAEFLKATGHRPPPDCADSRLNGPRQPVVGVSWLDARAYCDWAKLELPTEARWEAAARGTGGYPYPWGRALPTTELADFGKYFRSNGPDPVGSHPNGAGPYGAEDQAGGVWEWCLDEYEDSAYWQRDGQKDPLVESRDSSTETVGHVVRGGSWADSAERLHAAFRHAGEAGFRYQVLGFRVCLSV